MPNVYESPPETEEINIIFVDQDGYNNYSDCGGPKNYDQRPLMFVDGASGASTKSTIDGYALDHLNKIHMLDGDGVSVEGSTEPGVKYFAGNQSRINLAKASKMGRRPEYWKGPEYNYEEGRHPNKDYKTFQGGPVDIPPPAKRAGLYNPLNYGNLFNWLFYKYHEGIFCGLPDGRTFDNEPGSVLTKLENWDRGNISYGKERLYYRDMFDIDYLKINGPTFGRGLVNARQHTLVLQLDPRTIWNTNRTSMDFALNASKQYGEFPQKKTYYNGMGGVVGGTDTLSPVSYAYSNRSDYQKEAGTNFLPCCSRTDGSMSSTCPYPVHDRNFNFQEPVNRYNTLNNYIPGRASFSGTVTISRGGILPVNSQNNNPRDIDFTNSTVGDIPFFPDRVVYEMEYDSPFREFPEDKKIAPIMTAGWEHQHSGEAPRAYTEKEFLESTIHPFKQRDFV
ncbi:MAG TPA: hypothetical protein DEG32_17145, partial [Balneolaceae bacterium]|nr:hypothetical protein [Balneolaceae bacterium]